MIELFNYSLTQFLMVSPEVFQDLHQRYWRDFWPWLSVFIVCNSVVFLKNHQRLTFLYVSTCWLFIALVYFKHYLNEVHTFAYLMMALFIIQAIAIIVLKVILIKPLNQDTNYFSRLIKSAGLLMFLVSAVLPFSLFLVNSKGTLLLFGWGAEQTALGTIGLILYFNTNKTQVLLTIIPLSWLAFSVLFL